MKSLNLTINKLMTYAFDNLLSDALDETYMLNRLASLCGVTEPKLDPNADYGDMSLTELLAELKAASPAVDTDAVANFLFPMPRTVNYYFESKLARDKTKAMDFLFDLYAHGNNCLSSSDAIGKDGYLCYSTNANNIIHAATLSVGDNLVYTPRVKGNHIAMLEKPDILSDDMLSRMAAYVSAYGGAIAARASDDCYLCCDAVALASAKSKASVSDGAVKVNLLDYPVPALSFSGIAKNAVLRETARVMKCAIDKGVGFVTAAAAKDCVTFYIVFANDTATDEYLMQANALTACGVFRTADCAPLLPVLEKGTALSTDLAPFKRIYDGIGGVKLGAKAKTALGGALVDMFIPALAAAKSIDDEQALALAAPEQK